MFNRQPRELRMREAGIWVGIWILLAAAFNGYLFQHYGSAKGLEFTQGYLLGLALMILMMPWPFRHELGGHWL